MWAEEIPIHFTIINVIRVNWLEETHSKTKGLHTSVRLNSLKRTQVETPKYMHLSSPKLITSIHQKGKNGSQEPKVKISKQKIKQSQANYNYSKPHKSMTSKWFLAMTDKRKLVGVSQTNSPNAFNWICHEVLMQNWMNMALYLVHPYSFVELGTKV